LGSNLSLVGFFVDVPWDELQGDTVFAAEYGWQLESVLHDGARLFVV